MIFLWHEFTLIVIVEPAANHRSDTYYIEYFANK